MVQASANLALDLEVEDVRCTLVAESGAQCHGEEGGPEWRLRASTLGKTEGGHKQNGGRTPSTALP